MTISRYPRAYVLAGCYPGPVHGAIYVGDTGKGWEKIIKTALRLLGKIESGYPRTVNIEICQIKEKFGGLRIYFDVHHVDAPSREALDALEDDEHRACMADITSARELADAVVQWAEYRCWRTCEYCGADRVENDVGTNEQGWRKTLCADCRRGGRIS